MWTSNGILRMKSSSWCDSALRVLISPQFLELWLACVDDTNVCMHGCVRKKKVTEEVEMHTTRHTQLSTHN